MVQYHLNTMKRKGRQRPDMHGQRFGKLIVINRAPDDKFGKTVWNCKCDCGNNHTVRANVLRIGGSKSCGCYRRNLHYKHGHNRKRNRTPEYTSWDAMRQRCYNPKQARYADWGGRGIRVCDKWLTSFENFLADMGTRPKGHSLDRIDNAGNYEPTNCKWSTKQEQEANKRARGLGMRAQLSKSFKT